MVCAAVMWEAVAQSARSLVPIILATQYVYYRNVQRHISSNCGAIDMQLQLCTCVCVYVCVCVFIHIL